MANERWETAQAYERDYWKGIAQKIASDASSQMTWYDWKANELEKKIAQSGTEIKKQNCRVLEVGSGPIGIVTYLPWGERYALDPLNDFYMENPVLVELRNKDVTYLTGKGEALPFPDGHFDFVIIDNMLDHVSRPDLVLYEILRVLSSKGLLYVELNIHTSWGCFLHTLLAKLNIDKGHPHSYTAKKIKTFLSEHGFQIRWEYLNDYYEARTSDRKSSSKKAKIKGYSGLSEFIYFAFCSKIIS